MSIKILKLSNEDKSTIYRVKPMWKKKCFEMFILENAHAWYTDVTEEHLTKLASERSQSVDDYYNIIKQYISEPEPNISFDIRESSNSTTNVQFIIKRKVGGRTILFFNIDINKVDFQDYVLNLIDELHEETRNLNEELKRKKQKELILEEEKRLCDNKLAEFVELKTNWEREMYSNFLIVLNEKKKRINFLTEILSHKNINPDEVQLPQKSNVSVSSSSPYHEGRLEIISDSGSDSEYNMDKDNDDMNYEIIEDAPKPSTSKQSLEMLDDLPPPLSLPKIIRKPKEKGPMKLKHITNSIAEILPEPTQSNSVTQEPYLSTQERIDRM